MAKKTTKIQPLGDRVLLQYLDPKAEEVKGGIIIPDTAKEKPQQAKVVALGTGGRDDEGKLIPFSVKEGDIVLTSKYGGTEIKLDDEAYIIVHENDILGVVNS